ncbi:hypothetical protein XPA_009704 [Xanthoria parietina]
MANGIKTALPSPNNLTPHPPRNGTKTITQIHPYAKKKLPSRRRTKSSEQFLDRIPRYHTPSSFSLLLFVDGARTPYIQPVSIPSAVKVGLEQNPLRPRT